jgi:hypothetical protein
MKEICKKKKQIQRHHLYILDLYTWFILLGKVVHKKRAKKNVGMELFVLKNSEIYLDIYVLHNGSLD